MPTLTIWKCRKAFDRLISYLIRADRLAEADRLIQNYIHGRKDWIAQSCEKLPGGSVQITGWEYLIADIENVSKSDKPCTALGLDLSGHGEGAEPAIEVSFYTEESGYNFEDATRSDMLTVSRRYSAPWMGCFSEMGSFSEVQILGAAAVHSAIEKFANQRESFSVAAIPGADMSEEGASVFLAQWLVYLRFYEAVIEKVKTHGLSRRIPVLVGEHDYGTWIIAVQMAERIANREYESVTARILDERDAAFKASFDRDTQTQVDKITEGRKSLRSWVWLFKPEQKRLLVGLREAQENLLMLTHQELKASPLARKHTHDMTDQEFAEFIEHFRAARLNRLKSKQ